MEENNILSFLSTLFNLSVEQTNNLNNLSEDLMEKIILLSRQYILTKQIINCEKTHLSVYATQIKKKYQNKLSKIQEQIFSLIS